MSPRSCAIRNGRLLVESNESRIELDGSLLRKHCRCAECRAQFLTGSQTALENISVTAATPLGYGLQLHFSDGHNRGVFPWNYLAQIAAESNTLREP